MHPISYIRGLAIETVLGLSIQDKQTVNDIDISDVAHLLHALVVDRNDGTQRVEFSIDDGGSVHFEMHPFGPGEIQLWADNYQIGRRAEDRLSERSRLG